MLFVSKLVTDYEKNPEVFEELDGWVEDYFSQDLVEKDELELTEPTVDKDKKDRERARTEAKEEEEKKVIDDKVKESIFYIAARMKL